MAKPEIQTLGALRTVLNSQDLPDNTPIFFYCQTPEGAGLRSKTFEWNCTAVCIETDDRTGRIRFGFFSELDPIIQNVSESTENLQ